MGLLGLVMLTLGAQAQAADVVVVITPTPQSSAELRAAGPLRCEISDVQAGELLAAGTLRDGPAKLVPLIALEQAPQTSSDDVVWRAVVKSQQPGLISIARSTQDGPNRCPVRADRPCVQRFDRREQSLTVSLAVTAHPRPAAPDDRPTWDETSWYRPARAMTCGPLTPPTTPTPPTP